MLQGHNWGVHTLGDYKRWSVLRLTLRCADGCPVCGGVDGTAGHLLGEHAAPRVPEGIPETLRRPLWILRTDPPAAVLRRDIRLVGQLIHGRSDWRWRGEETRGSEDEVPTSAEEDPAESALPPP